MYVCIGRFEICKDTVNRMSFRLLTIHRYESGVNKLYCMGQNQTPAVF